MRQSSPSPRPKLTSSLTDITRLDWACFRSHGITGVVIDKDNCLVRLSLRNQLVLSDGWCCSRQTRPDRDTLEPYLQPSWESLLHTFGPANVLVVSNSAGTHKDSLLLQVRFSSLAHLSANHETTQAESVSRNLSVPVLVHADPKPGRDCALGIKHYFLPPPPSPPTLLRRLLPQRPSPSSTIWPARLRTPLPPTPVPRPHLLVIGDRLTTDVLLSHRLASLPSSPLSTTSILTTHLHASESLGTAFLRSLERWALHLLRRRRNTEGPWDSCIFPSSPLSLPKPVLKRLTGLEVEQLKEPWELVGEWRWTDKWKGLFVGEQGAVRVAEKVVQSCEDGVERGRLKLGLWRLGLGESKS